jgi:hypothetical protein
MPIKETSRFYKERGERERGGEEEELNSIA